MTTTIGIELGCGCVKTVLFRDGAWLALRSTARDRGSIATSGGTPALSSSSPSSALPS